MKNSECEIQIVSENGWSQKYKKDNLMIKISLRLKGKFYLNQKILNCWKKK